MAQAVAWERGLSLGEVSGESIMQPVASGEGARIAMSDYGFPTFRCLRAVASEDVRAVEEVE